MSTIYFLRHGARESGPGDPSLSALGRHQVRALARRLARRPVKAIYCSPRVCTWETGIAVSTTHRLPLAFEPRLRDRSSWGDVPHQSLAEYLAVWQQCNRLRDQAPRGGVSSRQAGARIEQLVKHIHDEFPSEAVVAVTHGSALMDFLRNVFPLEALSRYNPAVILDPYSSGVLPEASLTVVEYDGRHYSLTRLGDSDHLARLFQRPSAPQPHFASTLAPAIA